MASPHIFAWFEGGSITIPPETNDPTFGPKGAFEVQTFSLGSNNPNRPSGGGGGKPGITEVTLLKQVGKASPALLQAAGAGTLFPTMVIVSESTANSFIQYTFSKVRITQVSIQGNTGEPPLEEFTLVFATVQIQLGPPIAS